MDNIKCDNCGTSYMVKNSMIGKKGKCRNCGKIFLIKNKTIGVKYYSKNILTDSSFSLQLSIGFVIIFLFSFYSELIEYGGSLLYYILLLIISILLIFIYKIFLDRINNKFILQYGAPSNYDGLVPGIKYGLFLLLIGIILAIIFKSENVLLITTSLIIYSFYNSKIFICHFLGIRIKYNLLLLFLTILIISLVYGKSIYYFDNMIMIFILIIINEIIIYYLLQQKT